MTFREWLANNGACSKALEWLDTLEDQSPEAVWATCPRGDWLLWWHEQAGTSWEILEPVVRRCVNRALKHAGINFVVNTPDQYGAAEEAAGEEADAAWAARLATEAAEAAWGVWVARLAARLAAEAARVAARKAGRSVEARSAGWYGYAAERQQCADDCREMLAMPVGVE